MKIGLIALHAYILYAEDCASTHGGAEVQLKILGDAFARLGHDVHVFVSSSARSKVFRRDSVTIHNCSHGPTRSFFAKVFSLARLSVSIVKANCDVYLQRNAGYESAFVWLLSRMRGKKFVYMTSHMIDCTGEYKTLYLLRGCLYEFALKKADHVITQSDDQKRAVHKKYGIESTVFRSSYPMPQHQPEAKGDYVLWVGRIVQWKKPHMFLEIAERMPERRFIMIGPQSCSNAYFDDFRKHRESLTNVIYIQYVAFKDIDRYFRDARVFVNTSTLEGFPNTFIQAFMHGTPVLSMRVDPDDIIKRNKLGLVSTSSAAIDDFLLMCGEDNTPYKNMSERCYAYARESHDINRNLPKLVDLLDQVV